MGSTSASKSLKRAAVDTFSRDTIDFILKNALSALFCNSSAATLNFPDGTKTIPR